MSENKSPPPSSPGGPATPRRNVPLMLLVLGLITAVILVVSKPRTDAYTANIKQVDEWIAKDYVLELTISDGNRIEGIFRDDDNVRLFTEKKGFVVAFTGKGENNPLTQDLQNSWNQQLNDNRARFLTKESGSTFLTAFLSFLPWLLLMILFWWLIMRQMRNVGGAGVMQFGRSKAKVHVKEQSNVTFEDVAGIEEAKDEVEEIVTFLKAPQKFRRIGARIPRGVLLVGPPGCGKTLLAKAIAGEAEVPFFSVSGSDFVEMLRSS